MTLQIERPAPAPPPARGTGRRLLAPLRGGAGRQARLAAVLLLPAALVVFGVVLYPAGRALVISFYDVTSPFPGAYPFRGLANYVDILRDHRTWVAAQHTAYFTVVSTVVELVLGVDSERKALEDVATPLKAQRPRVAAARPQAPVRSGAA